MSAALTAPSPSDPLQRTATNEGVLYKGEGRSYDLEPSDRGKVRLRVNVEGSGTPLIDTVDLNSAKARRSFAERLAGELHPELAALYDQDLRYIANREADAKVEPAEQLDRSVPGLAAATTLKDLLRLGGPVLDAPDQLALLRQELRRVGYAGDTAPVELLYVAFASRLLERPINVSVEGPSAGGKSYAVDLAQAFHPPEAIRDLTAISERALVYSDFETAHAYVIIAEGSALHHDGPGATIIRDLAWGKGLRYETVEKTEAGQHVARLIEKPGPTGLVTTTTKPLDPEVATRLLHLQINDTPEQTRAVVRSLAARAAVGGGVAADVEPWRAAQRWLAVAGEHRVVIPFAPALAEGVPADDVRMRRDFEQVLAVVQVHALLHQRHREHDPAGRIVAAAADYEAAYRLLASVMAMTLDNVSDAGRDTVETVARLNADRQEPGVSYVELAQALGITREAARQRSTRLLRERFLVNKEQRQGHPAKLVPGDPLPESRPVLPSSEDLFGATLADSPSDLDASAQPVTARAEATAKEPVKMLELSSLTPDRLDGGADGPIPKPEAELRRAVKASSRNPGGDGHTQLGDGLAKRRHLRERLRSTSHGYVPLVDARQEPDDA